MLERFAFKTEYKNTKEYNKAAILSVCISVIFIALSIVSYNIYSLSYTFGLGAIIYQIYTMFILYGMAEKKIKIGRHFVTFALFLLMLTAGVMVYKFDKTMIRQNPLGVAIGFIFIIGPVFFWKELMQRAKKHMKFLLLGFVLPLLFFNFSPAFSQNETNQTGTLEKISGILNIAQNIVKYISDILGFFGSIQSSIQVMLGISAAHAQVINISIILVMIYFFFRTMKWLVKWVILILFTWVALQIIGIL